MPAAATALAPGFADPVHGAQRAFRAVMDAMARPGAIRTVRGLAGVPAPLSPVAAALALTLADYETPLFLDPPLAAGPEVARYLAFHTGARIAAAPAEAAFALIAEPAAVPDFADFALGTDTYPDRSTTLILQVGSLAAGGRDDEHSLSSPAERSEGARVASASLRLRLEGPGIRDTATLAVAGLPADIAERLAANRALFPRGVDLILAGPDGVAALPRTTRVSILEA